MIKKDNLSDEKVRLRKQAEEIAWKNSVPTPENFESLSPEEIQLLIHELHVHQIELEMQNEELRTAQEQLELSRARYFDLYDLAPVGYFTINKDGLIKEVNLAVSLLLGVDRKELVNQPISRFILPLDQDIYYLHRKKLFETTESQACELRLLKKNSESIWTRLESILAYDENDEVSCRVVVIDISERKQAEAERIKFEQITQQTQKLETLGVLAGGIAHDFNNLMGGVFGYIDLSRAQSTESIVIENLSKAMNAIERARGLTQQLLTFSKGGSPILQTAPLFPFIKDNVLFALSGSNVICNFDVPDDLWESNYDKNRIGQVIDNLIINAVQAMPAGGSITLQARNVQLNENEHSVLPLGNYIKISITDTGVGIPNENFVQIFDPFFTTKDKGSGLGLATSYSIINRHGGCIDIESELGKGSTFHVYLPAAIGLKSTIDEQLIVKHKGRGTILIMDDVAVIRETIGDMLEFFGYNVVRKTNGHEVIKFFADELQAGNKIVAMIFDLTIPMGIGGIDTIKEIRKLDLDIPVFVSSGYSIDPVMTNPAEFGFTASISKPFTATELAILLNKYLKNYE